MQVRSLGVIPAGTAQGIEILDHPKHGTIDPARFSNPQRLRAATDHRSGSKWLPDISAQNRFDMIRQILEAGGAQLHGPSRTYHSGKLPQPVGISNGNFVSRIEVEFF